VSTPGLILFAHGARDPRWVEPFERLRAKVAARESGVPVVLAFLELITPDLETAASDLVDRGCTALTIVPVFLGRGGHVRHDLPELIARVAAAHPDVGLKIAGAIGENDAVLDAMAQVCSDELALLV
jgi:sirohydrochlorin cobaltochelatase